MPFAREQQLAAWAAAAARPPGVARERGRAERGTRALFRVHSQQGGRERMTDDRRTRLFISYSQRDVHWLHRLQVHLKPIQRAGLVDPWDDSCLVAGDCVREQINRALAEARVAIILVSADLLASDFVHDVELPVLLARSSAAGVLILPIIVAPCLFDRSPLAPFRPINPESSLTAMSDSEQEAVIVAGVRAVLRALMDGAPGSGETPAAKTSGVSSIVHPPLTAAELEMILLRFEARRAPWRRRPVALLLIVWLLAREFARALQTFLRLLPAHVGTTAAATAVIAAIVAVLIGFTIERAPTDPPLSPTPMAAENPPVPSVRVMDASAWFQSATPAIDAMSAQSEPAASVHSLKDRRAIPSPRHSAPPVSPVRPVDPDLVALGDELELGVQSCQRGDCLRLSVTAKIALPGDEERVPGWTSNCRIDAAACTDLVDRTLATYKRHANDAQYREAVWARLKRSRPERQ